MARYKGFGIALLLVVAMVSVLGLSGCGTKAPVAPDTTTPAPAASTAASSSTPANSVAGHSFISVNDQGFVPANVTVTIGTKVIWTNDGKATHNVTPDAGGPNSGKIKPGDTAAHVFGQAGTFNYHDKYHPELKGVVTVH